LGIFSTCHANVHVGLLNLLSSDVFSVVKWSKMRWRPHAHIPRESVVEWWTHSKFVTRINNMTLSATIAVSYLRVRIRSQKFMDGGDPLP